MNNIKSTLIILLIVSALCTGFYFYGKNNESKIIVKDIDTTIVTKIDTVTIKTEKIVQTIDTVVIVNKDTIHYELAKFDTIIVKDSSKVSLNISYDEYFNKFTITSSFYPLSKEIFINKYINNKIDNKHFYIDISALTNKKNIMMNTDCGIVIKNNYHFGIIFNTFGYYGIQVGRSL